MKNIIKLLLVVFLLFSASYAHAEEEFEPMLVTVGEMYILNSKNDNNTSTEEESINLLILYNFFDGVRWGYAMIKRNEMENEKVTRAIMNCINDRPIGIVFDNICTQYKTGNFKASDKLFHIVEKDYMECALKSFENKR